jgi:molybdopterin molybdotransferase
MKTFFKVKSVAEVLDMIRRFPPLETETVALEDAGARVLGTNLVADSDVPEFDRSSMDGFAVRARDTFGAGEGLPALFEVVGEVFMGSVPTIKVGPGQAARIWTGGMLPRGADAVVMVEYARTVDQGQVELSKPVAPGENVILQGEDVAAAQVLLPKGHLLRPQDLGILAALGKSNLAVYRRPRVAIISTGDEIVPVGEMPGPGKIRDINTYTLSALIQSYLAMPIRLGLVGDNPAKLREAVAQGLDQAEVVLISGGSSVGVRDYTVEIFNSFSDAELLIHGVSVSPGKPTIMSRLGNQSLWGLPGHAVSAMVTCGLFVRPLLRQLSGRNLEEKNWGLTVEAVLTRNVPSVHGRQDYIRVRLQENGSGLPLAIPVLGKSGLISTMVKADGLIEIGLNDEGLLKGSPVEVFLFN